MSSATNTPKAFVSHASEDKSNYGEPLARKLRELGIDAWLDMWEIKAGDSLVTKILNEGMAQTDAVIVLLSKTSISKPWVEKELSVAVVQSINRVCRIIPVRVDECDVPTSLSDLLWVDWTKEGGLEGVSRRIEEVLFEHDLRPALGTPPKYLESVQFQVPGLTNKDVILLQCLFEAALHGHREIMQTADIWPFAEAKGLSEEDVTESSEVLLDRGYLWDKGSNLHHGYFIAEFSSIAFLEVAKANGHDIAAMQRQIASLVINEDVTQLDDLIARTSLPRGLIEAILDNFEHEGMLKTISSMGGMDGVYEVKAQFKRWLAGAPK